MRRQVIWTPGRASWVILGVALLVVGCGPTDDDGGFAGDAGTGDVLMCSDTQLQCNNQCVDHMTNGSHCGKCGNACTGGTFCSEGTCTCIKEDYKRCDGACVDRQTNNDHCGKCGNDCPGGTRCESGTCETLTIIEQVIKETNEVRSTQTDCDTEGLKPAVPPVEGNGELHKAAQMHSDRMAMFNFFAHDDPRNGTNFADRIGMTNYSGSPVGENIAVGQRTAEQVVEGWRESDGHCANMMRRRANEIGVGYAEDNDGTRSPYWTQVFGHGSEGL